MAQLYKDTKFAMIVDFDTFDDKITIRERFNETNQSWN